MGPATFSVSRCYSVLDLMRMAGVPDLTEGKYGKQVNLQRRTYIAAQVRQAEYLLAQAGCKAGSRLLDIGCGYGRLIALAKQRGAKAVGISVSPEQVRHGMRLGLDVRLCDYCDMPLLWQEHFDCIVANGSLEHFCGALEALADRGDATYRDFFQRVAGVCRPDGRLVTTAIHFSHRGHTSPEDWLKPPDEHPRNSNAYHFSQLARAFTGWYPEPGQLQRCADGFFRLIDEEDGTNDYRVTSEYWLKRARWQLAVNPRIWWGLVWKLVCWYQPTMALLRCCVIDQSWQWQFRGPTPPTRLLRQTWVRAS